MSVGKEAIGRSPGTRVRRTQVERRARSRAALLEAAARGFSTYGYANLSLAWVAAEAGYTRGALYHQFADKGELALAVVEWVDQTWHAEVGRLFTPDGDPVETLLAVARRHAVYCRREVASVLLTLRVEFTGQHHPVGHAIDEIVERLRGNCLDLITAGRANGTIPPGPPPRDTAGALISVLEAVGIELAGRAPYDTELTENAARGVLGLTPPPDRTDTEQQT